tara:strand:+ start:3269 stop:3442 length:174 start_codon:yes stop_codon:yes gene_type:complete
LSEVPGSLPLVLGISLRELPATIVIFLLCKKERYCLSLIVFFASQKRTMLAVVAVFS